MKTANRSTRNFPRPGRFSLYVCAVMVLCFFNWVALNAQTLQKVNALEYQLVINQPDEIEPAIQLQDWMMDVEKSFLAVDAEPALNVEPWMLSFNHEYMAETGESMINFEPWMVNFKQRCLVVENEEDYPVECWMTSTCTWGCLTRLIAGM